MVYVFPRSFVGVHFAYLVGDVPEPVPYGSLVLLRMLFMTTYVLDNALHPGPRFSV